MYKIQSMMNVESKKFVKVLKFIRLIMLKFKFPIKEGNKSSNVNSRQNVTVQPGAINNLVTNLKTVASMDGNQNVDGTITRRGRSVRRPARLDL